MAEPYIGEIRIFAGNFPPSGWAFCDGQLLSVATNETLFTLIGTTYGGDAVNSFGLPDLRGRIPVGVGAGPGLPPVALGQMFGSEAVTLTPDTLPPHSHSLSASSVPATAHSPENISFAATTADVRMYPDSNKPTAAPRAFSPAIIRSATGGAQPHDNMMPTTAIHHIISLQGYVPHSQ
ncbi:MAG: tail fiber protein [Sphingopyxis sp.]